MPYPTFSYLPILRDYAGALQTQVSPRSPCELRRGSRLYGVFSDLIKIKHLTHILEIF